MLVTPTAVTAHCNNHRLVTRNVGNDSATFGILNKGTLRHLDYKVCGTFAVATVCLAVFAVFGNILTLVAEICQGGKVGIGHHNNVSTLAAGLFSALRELDDPSISKVYARCPEGGGVAYAVQNRLKKAAAFQVINADEQCVVGITGGSDSGKTTLLRAVENAGGMVLDCDAIYHELLATDIALLAAIENRFPGVITEGNLDRKKLGNIVFADENALLDLNRITHAAVKKEVLRRLASAPQLAAIDAIGLHDSGLDNICDITVAITAPASDRIARLMIREGDYFPTFEALWMPLEEQYIRLCGIEDNNVLTVDTGETFEF